MPQMPQMPQRSRGVLRGYAVEAVVVAFLLVLVVVIVVPAYFMGAFQQVPVQSLPQIQAGQTASYGEFHITPTDAIVTTKDPTGPGLDDDEKKKAYLVVHARIENRSRTEVFGSQLAEDYELTPPGWKKPAHPKDVGLVRDHSSTCTLLPHLPEQVQMIWEIPITAGVPTGITLTIFKRTWRKDFFENDYQWLSPEPWLNVQLPVRQADP